MITPVVDFLQDVAFLGDERSSSFVTRTEFNPMGTITFELSDGTSWTYGCTTEMWLSYRMGDGSAGQFFNAFARH